MEFDVGHVEEVTTEPESEEAVEKLYMNRLLMLGRAGELSTPPLHTPPRHVSLHGLSPEIGLLSQRGIIGPADSSQVSKGPLTDSLNQSDTVCREDEGSTNMGISKVQPPKCLSTHGLSHGACSETSAEDSQRSVRKHAQGMSKIKKDNGRTSKSRSKEPGSRNSSSGRDWTPLHEAVLGHHYAVAETLLKAGAIVNSVGFEGVTPLQDAVQIGDFKLVHLLLKCGANPLMKNHNGDNAIDLNQDSTVEKLLKRYAAKPCRRTRQSAAIDGDEDQQTSKAEVCPDSKDVSKENYTFSANPKAQNFPQLRDPTKVSDNDGSLPAQGREPPGSDTASCPDSEITVDYTESRSTSPEHWALSATQDFSGTTER